MITSWHTHFLVKFIVLSCYQFCYWLLCKIYFVLFVTHAFYVLYMSWSLPDIHFSWSNLSSFHVTNFVFGYLVKFILFYLWLLHFMCCICPDLFLTCTLLGQINFFVCDSPKRFSPFFLHDWRICSIHQMAQMICLHLKVQTDIIHSKFSHETVQYTPNSWTIHLSAKMKLLWHLLMILAICVQS